MQKLLGILILFSILGACKKVEKTTAKVEKQELEFNYRKMPDKIEINSDAAAIIDEWNQFKDLNASIDVLYKATNNEDLALAIDDLIEKEKKMADGKYPELFDTFQVKSRQRVLRTFLYKAKANIMENQPTTESIVDVLEAYNNIRRQLNVIVNSQLDKKLILDEG
ncbi:MAG: hypothetical protein CMH46_05640 [Muricauda sp.]|nr:MULTISPECIES: hypothetical protein [unclassified Allomuricauda]MAU15006.1 hypothetical protein [Allomuricauda sp.]|tara:strand:+ start:7784 stop:8281 length:498 start_codon:yes stop_codon:yes gene_type:complete